jgi:hypothetical protein
MTLAHDAVSTKAKPAGTARIRFVPIEGLARKHIMSKRGGGGIAYLDRACFGRV